MILASIAERSVPMQDVSVYTKPVVYKVDGMDRVDVRRDERYRGADADVTMDVYRPSAASAAWPAVLFVHGGPVPEGVRPKDWGIYTSYGRLAAASGLVGVTFNYRYWRPDSIAAASDDVRAAITYARDHAAYLRIDRDRIAVWVFSGGAPVVSFLLAEAPAYLRAVAGFYAPLALPSRDASPARAHLPILVARAGQDDARLNAAIDTFIASSLAANVPLEVHTHPNGRHGFDILDDDRRSRDIVARTLAMIRNACE
jgi:acetyl esterase/lipase